jgi:hypothetical protein
MKSLDESQGRQHADGYVTNITGDAHQKDISKVEAELIQHLPELAPVVETRARRGG